MRNQIAVNQEFYILSRSIDNASLCKVVDICEDCFKVKIDSNVKFEQDESVELFAHTNKGRMYFETIIKEVNDGILSVWFPLSYKFLQKREYSRVNIEQEIILKTSDTEILGKIIDISAGGLKIFVNCQLELLSEYKFDIILDDKKIEMSFEPLRIEAIDGTYIVSGRMKNIGYADRISLVQFCYRKYIENSIK